MPKKAKHGGKFSFGEWIVGGTIEQFLGTIPPEKKQPPRKVFSVDVETDDESDAHSIKITFPNPRSTKPTESDEEVEEPVSVPKKVRFDGIAQKKPLKSAMKQTPPTSEETTEESDTETEAESSEAAASPPVKTKKQLKGQQQPKQKPKVVRKNIQPDESERELEPEPEPEPKKKQAKPQQQQKQKPKAKAPQSSHDVSTSSKKARKKAQSFSSPSASDESEIDSESGSEDELAVKLSMKQLQKLMEGKGRANSVPFGDVSSHDRRPHLLGPVRSEVVQTERVLESPDDPQPNAYYDGRNNIMRVYHGPKWGHHPKEGLYPLRDPNSKRPPLGMPHPSYNSYNYPAPPYGERHRVEAYPVHAPRPVTDWDPYAGRWEGPSHSGYPPPADKFIMRGGNGLDSPNKQASNNVGPRQLVSGKPNSDNGKKDGSTQGNNNWGNTENNGNTRNGWGNTGNDQNSSDNTWGNTQNDQNNNGDSWGGMQNDSGKQKSPETYKWDKATGGWSGDGKSSDLGAGDATGALRGWGKSSYTGSNDNENSAWPDTSNDSNQGSSRGAWSKQPSQKRSTFSGWNTGDGGQGSPQPGSGSPSRDHPSTPVASPTNPLSGDNNIGPSTMPGAWTTNNSPQVSPPAWGDPSLANETGGKVDEGPVPNPPPENASGNWGSAATQSSWGKSDSSGGGTSWNEPRQEKPTAPAGGW